MKRFTINTKLLLAITPALGGLALVMMLLLVLAKPAAPAQADPGVLYVAPSGNCSGASPCYANVQAAVDASRDGDVIKVARGVYTDVHARPRNDFTTTGVVTQVVYISKTVTIQGGYTADFVEPPTPVANPTTLDARGEGRVLYITGNVSPTIEGLRITGGDTTRLKGCYPWGTCLDAGGGIYIITATATVSGCQVYSNTSSMFGGGISLHSSAAELKGNTIQANTVMTTGWGGGGVFLSSSAATLSANSIMSNSAGSGGGVLLYYSGDTLSGNTISDNSGSGVSLFKSAGTLNDNLISGNMGHYGGGVRLEGSAPTLLGNIISGNTGWDGGGIFVTPIAEMLHDNAAFLGSRGNLENTVPTLSGNTISDNEASQGGGLYVEQGGATLNDNIISGNTATDSGGGAHLRGIGGDAPVLNGNTFSSNTAYLGGGVYLWGSDTMLNGNTMLGNVAQQVGGGIAVYVSNPTLVNNIIADNHASGGSGVYVEGGTPRFLHTTIARNIGGDGLFVAADYIGSYYSAVALTNTILASHSMGIRVTGGNTVRVNGVLWYSTPITVLQVATVSAPTATVIVQNQYEGDPRFAADGYHLTAGSAAIDRGVDAEVRTDIDNQPRPYQVPDLGADEYWPPGALKYIYLPFVLKDSP